MNHLGDYYDSGRMFTYIRGFAMGKHWNETLNAMNFARKLHEGQNRKSGEPYIIHPLTMACHALAMGLEDDEIIASLLLHDVVEDCNVSTNDLPVSPNVRFIVNLLTHEKETPLENYYGSIAMNGKASICKIIDRCNNVSTMSGVFKKQKLLDYIVETNAFILPLIRSTKEKFPEYQNALFLLKYQIVTLLSSIEGALEMYNGDTDGSNHS